MSDVSGGIGAGTVIVFQPATPKGALEVALGIQRFWQKTLKSAGRPAACLIANTRIETIDGTPPAELPIAVGDKGVAAIGDWADQNAVGTVIVTRGGRWGLVPTLVPEGTACKLDTMLLEAKAETGVSTTASWSFDGSAGELPEHVFAVLAETARRVGVRAPWSSAVEAFDTSDAGAAMLTLEQMGILSMAEDGCRLKIAVVLERLGLLVTAAPRSHVVIALVPELLGHLARLGAHDIQLASWLRSVKKNTGTLPQEWDRLVQQISRMRN